MSDMYLRQHWKTIYQE